MTVAACGPTTLWVLRHGEATNFASTDAARPLTPQGREQVRRSASQLIGERLDLILVSPYLRAQQTAQLVEEVLGQGTPMQTVDWLTPDSDPDAALAALGTLQRDAVLIVSHQPLVGTLVSLLDRAERSSLHPMGTASLARLEGQAPLAGLMSLRSLRHTPS